MRKCKGNQRLQARHLQYGGLDVRQMRSVVQRRQTLSRNNRIDLFLQTLLDAGVVGEEDRSPLKWFRRWFDSGAEQIPDVTVQQHAVWIVFQVRLCETFTTFVGHSLINSGVDDAQPLFEVVKRTSGVISVVRKKSQQWKIIQLRDEALHDVFYTVVGANHFRWRQIESRPEDDALDDVDNRRGQCDLRVERSSVYLFQFNHELGDLDEDSRIHDALAISKIFEDGKRQMLKCLVFPIVRREYHSWIVASVKRR